jgi:uncharacterized protein (TIGR02271 family)
VDLTSKLKQGLRVVGADDRDYGTIDRYDDQYAYVGERRIPVGAFDRLDNGRLYVGAQGRRYFEGTDDLGGDEIRVPLAEERLFVDKQAVELGSVDIRKDVETERVEIPVELRHEEVRVNRMDVRDRPVTAGELRDAFQEGTIRVPVRGEAAVVEKEAVVTGEVVIDKEQRTERQTVTDTIRREEVAVDHTEGAPVHHRQGHIPHADER